MRVRHRIPSIFNLSMVDVLCCALGCVILLWLLNLREAKYHQDTAEEEHRQTTTELDAARRERDSANRQVRSLEEERDTLRRQATNLRDTLSDRDRQLQAATARATGLEEERDAAGRRLAGAAARLIEEQDKRKLAEARMRDLEAELQATRKRFAEEEAMARGLGEQIRRRMDELGELRRRLGEAQTAQEALQQEWARRNRAGVDRLAVLEQDKKDLQNQIMRLQVAAAARFAGIELVGQRVAFLVDMSASMTWLDDKKEKPEKWTEVGKTVEQVMRSLPELKKYQVIVFSDKAAYLLGGDGDWLDFDPLTSPRHVRQKLAEIKPDGGTDMYAALAAAFRLRDKGLDTIYLFSDGLPNLGEGLPPGGKDLPEAQKNILLGGHIRKTLEETWNPRQPGRPRVRINAVGFFYESPEVGAFLWALARENDGSFVGMSKP
jgi:hypothetical protein